MQSDIALGFAPQLALEAAMALAGAFPGVAGTSIEQLTHWKLSGNREGGADKPVKGDPMQLAEQARMGLIALITAFSRDEALYVATPDPQFAPKYDDYEHLARNAEWLSERELWP
jgi:ATP-dependent helicase/nuclease subunit B